LFISVSDDAKCLAPKSGTHTDGSSSPLWIIYIVVALIFVAFIIVVFAVRRRRAMNKVCISCISRENIIYTNHIPQWWANQKTFQFRSGYFPKVSKAGKIVSLQIFPIDGQTSKQCFKYFPKVGKAVNNVSNSKANISQRWTNQ
jgi:hypothetical protein